MFKKWSVAIKSVLAVAILSFIVLHGYFSHVQAAPGGKNPSPTPTRTPTPTPTPTPSPTAGPCTRWTGQESLQSALYANVCTELPAGIHTVTNYLVLPDGHTLQGDPIAARTDIVLKPGATWNANGNEGIVNGGPVPHSGLFTVRHFTLDGAGMSTGGVGAGDMVIDDMVVRGGKCWGIAIVNPRTTVTNSHITQNGASPDCPSAPGAGIYIASNNPGPGRYAPYIRNNEISNNTGPGVDIYHVWDGDFQFNNVHDNTSWAGVSLLGSNWTIANNTIVHPQTDIGQPWVSACSGGPSGAHSSAVMICFDTGADGHNSQLNRITGNALSSWYGILLIGNDNSNALAVPYKNTISGNTYGTSQLKRADDLKQSNAYRNYFNIWQDGAPTYF